MKTQCNYCGQVATNQPPGNGCHTCLLGVMEIMLLTFYFLESDDGTDWCC